MAVVLIGAPGAGKTTAGLALAERLGWQFTDTDQLIEATQRRSVAEIFAVDGEPAFRGLEREAAVAVLAEPGDRVVSLGGGAVLQEEIFAALAPHHVVWLKASAGAAADRVGLNVARPLLLGNIRGRLIKLLAERTPVYARAADQVVDTDPLGPGEVVDVILADLP